MLYNSETMIYIVQIFFYKSSIRVDYILVPLSCEKNKKNSQWVPAMSYLYYSPCSIWFLVIFGGSKLRAKFSNTYSIGKDFIK